MELIQKSYFSNLLTGIYGIYKRNINECRKHFGEESVHDLRVSIRRFETLNWLLGQLFKSKYIELLSNALAKRIKIFGNLRDTQVQILKSNDLRFKFPELNHFYYDLLAYEQNLIKWIKKQLNLLDDSEIDEFVIFLKLQIQSQAYSSDNLTGTIYDTISLSYDEIYEKANAVNSENAKTIHNLRLSFKNFRYLMEHLQKPLLLDKQYMTDLRHFQTMMGEIQDNQVLQKLVIRHIKSQNEIPDIAFLPAIKYISDEGKMLIDTFTGKLQTIENFRISQ